jgi:Na+/H+ antiporter NhaC
VLLSFGISKIPKLANPSGVGGEYDTDRYLAGLINGSKAELMAFLFVWAIIFLFFITAFSGIMYAFIKNTSNNKNRVLPEKGRNNLLGLLWLLPGLLLIGLIYLGQGVDLKGIKIEEISALLKFLGI